MAYILINADCFSWMTERDENTITAIVTDPPYGVKGYTEIELEKQRAGKSGVWRIPPAFDGHVRKALPRFSVINDDPKERRNIYEFFFALGNVGVANSDAGRARVHCLDAAFIRCVKFGDA